MHRSNRPIERMFTVHIHTEIIDNSVVKSERHARNALPSAKAKVFERSRFHILLY